MLVTDVTFASINCKIGSVSLFVCMLLFWLPVRNLSLSCIISSAPLAFKNSLLFTFNSQETVSPTSVAMSMMYAKRLQRKRPDYIKKVSSSDLFIISMVWLRVRQTCVPGVYKCVYGKMVVNVITEIFQLLLFQQWFNKQWFNIAVEEKMASPLTLYLCKGLGTYQSTQKQILKNKTNLTVTRSKI